MGEKPKCFEPDCDTCEYNTKCKNRKYSWCWDSDTTWIPWKGASTTHDGYKYEYYCIATDCSSTHG